MVLLLCRTTFGGSIVDGYLIFPATGSLPLDHSHKLRTASRREKEYVDTKSRNRFSVMQSCWKGGRMIVRMDQGGMR